MSYGYRGDEDISMHPAYWNQLCESCKWTDTDLARDEHILESLVDFGVFNIDGAMIWRLALRGKILTVQIFSIVYVCLSSMSICSLRSVSIASSNTAINYSSFN